MERKQKLQKLMICWSIVTAGLIALFWLIWYLVAGEVPIATSINKMTENWPYSLPFSISRWWDILIGPIWSIIIIFLLTSKLKEEKDLVARLVFTLGVALVYTLVFGLVAGRAAGLLAGLLAGLVFGLHAGLDFRLVFALVFTLGVALRFGLVFGLVFTLDVGLVFGLVVLLKLLTRVHFRTKVWNWLLAK